MIKIILASLFFYSTSFAGLPPTTLKGQSASGTAPVTFNTQVPNNQATRLNSTTALIETGNNNMMVNPGFESGLTTDWTNYGGTSTISNVANSTFGTRALQAITLAGTYAGDFVTSNAPAAYAKEWTGLNIQGSWYINVPYSGYALCIYRTNSSNTPETSSCSTITARTGWQQVSAYVGGGDNTKKYYVVLTKTGTISVGSPETVLIDEVYVGPATNIGQGTPPNEFGAYILANGTVSYYSPTTSPAWISGCAKSGTNSSIGTCTLNGFTSAPVCTFTPGATANGMSARLNSITANQIVYQTYDTSTSAQSIDLMIKCNKAGSDFVQPTVTAANWNFTGRTYTPTITTNSGTISNYTITAKYSRNAGRLFVDGVITFTGTSSAFTGIRVSLPPGLAKSVNFPPDIAGNSYWLDFGTEFGATGSTVFDGPGTAVNLLTPSTVSGTNPVRIADGIFTNTYPATWTTNDKIYFRFNFLASENGVDWQETYNALQLLGSVTNNSPNAWALQTARVGGATPTTVCSSGSCTIHSGTPGWLTSVTWTSTGRYTAVLAGFSATPSCWAVFADGSNAFFPASLPTSSTGWLIASNNSTGTATNSYMDLFCYGPR